MCRLKMSCCPRVSLQGQTKSPRSSLPFISPSASPHPNHVPPSAQLFLDPPCFLLLFSLSAPPGLAWISPASTSVCPPLLSLPHLLFHAALLPLPSDPALVPGGPAGPGVSAVLQCIFRPQHFPSAPECLFSRCQLGVSVLLLHCYHVLQLCCAARLCRPSR